MPRTKGLKDYPSELKEKILKQREAGCASLHTSASECFIVAQQLLCIATASY
ncbi:MAG: hypothetical protein IJF38_05795 [Clostridia bacterium]|nr:hypothetical protein [Clostridia bacterium]